MNPKIFKRIAIALWLLLLVFIWGYYLLNPIYFETENLALMLSKYKGHLLLIYTVIGVLRGLTLLPNMTLLIVGTLLFPDNYTILLITSVFGITASSTMIYYFSDFLGFDYFLRKNILKK